VEALGRQKSASDQHSYQSFAPSEFLLGSILLHAGVRMLLDGSCGDFAGSFAALGPLQRFVADQAMKNCSRHTPKLANAIDAPPRIPG